MSLAEQGKPPSMHPLVLVLLLGALHPLWDRHRLAPRCRQLTHKCLLTFSLLVPSDPAIQIAINNPIKWTSPGSKTSASTPSHFKFLVTP